MTSWDCFDTLVARRFIYPYTIFEEVGRQLKIENFVKLRTKAEKRSNGTYFDIYNNLKGIDPNLEFQIELEHLFGIRENIDRVQDGDIIVSDMYFTKEQIKTILESCGLKKNIEIYVTPDGKKKGYIWEQLPKIDLHIGDNEYSDIESPKKFSIQTEYYTNHKLNAIEEYVYSFDKNLACWMRLIRLNCPYISEHEKNLWLDQSSFNAPILALASLELPDKEIAFTFRDSIYWKQIYEKLTGKKSKELHTSRICYYNPSKEFINYINEISKDCIIVDLQGSGKSINTFFNKENPAIYICGPTEFPVISIAGKISDAIERHNCSHLGTLLDWDANGPIRDVCEHDTIIIEVQSEAMRIAADSIHNFSIQKNVNLLKELLWKMKNNYTHQNVRWE